MSLKVKSSLDPEIESYLNSPNWKAVEFIEGQSRLAKHLNYDATAIISTTASLPPCLRDEAHRSQRKRLARLISDQKREVLARLNDGLPHLVAPILRPGIHDLVDGFFVPLTELVISAYVGRTINLPSNSLLSRIFIDKLSGAKRQRLNTELTAAYSAFSVDMPDLQDQEIWDRIALMVLGNDALKGSLACSFREALIHDAEQRDAHLWTTSMPIGGIRCLDRQKFVAKIVATPKEFVRLQVGGSEGKYDPEETRNMFSGGAHTCLGRQMAMHIWTSVIRSLGPVMPAMKIVEYKLRNDEIFRIPTKFKVEVT